MSSERFDRIAELFEAACRLAPEERAEFLATLCEDDAELRSEVEALLGQDERLESSGLVDRIERGIADEAAAAVESESALPERIGPYRILGSLGTGGMGVVYRAEQENPRRTVALKVVRSGLPDVSALRRFEFEAQVLGRLQHPGIAQVHEAGVAEMEGGGQIPYFAMELIEGETLTRYAERTGLTVRDRLELFARVCDAVHHAHQKGVIHRDLKPANILVVRGSPAPGDPKVLDFGVARVSVSEARSDTFRTVAGQLVGTLPYMSPEQVSGDPDALDTRSDVYSLGVVLFELLSGELPIQAGDTPVPEAARRITEQEPTRLGRLDSAYRGDIETIVAQALEKDPDRRYASAAELAADLRRTLRDEPISARPASRIYWIGKFARRNRSIVVGAALVFIALLAGFFAERHQRKNAESARIATEQANADLKTALEGSEKVTRFLTDLFASANPNETAGRNVTIREKLIGVDDRLAGFTDQPEIESRIRNAIGETFYGLGEYQLAREHLERAIELRVQLHGEKSPATLRSRSTLATVLLMLNEKEEGHRLAELAFEGFREKLGIQHEETLTALGVLATAHDRLGLPDPEDRYREVFELCREHLGPEHQKTLQAQSNYAIQLQERGSSDEAEPHFREILAIRQEILSERHPDIALSLNNLGFLLNGSGRYEEALPYLTEAYQLAAETLGESHSRTILYGNNLGVSYYALERYEEARPYFESAARRSLEELGPDNPSTLLARGNYAGLIRKTGDIEGALELFPDIVAGLRRAHPPGHPVIFIYGRIHGLTLMEAERYADAEPLLIEAARGIRRVFGPNHVRTSDSRRSVVELYEAWGKPEEAEPWRAPESND